MAGVVPTLIREEGFGVISNFLSHCKYNNHGDLTKPLVPLRLTGMFGLDCFAM
jgi:hypothetical protein